MIMLGTLVNLELGVLAMTAPVLSQTYSEQPQPTIVPAQPDAGQRLNQLVMQWGFTLAPCSSGVVTIASGTAKVCVNPTLELPAGDYTYEPALNQIIPVNSQTTVVSPRFTFTNVLQYSNCLESILQLYQNSGSLSQQKAQNSCLADIYQIYRDQGLSKSQALELVSSANFYATTMLSREIYPPRGQRIRVAQMLKFIYEIDANDEEMQRLAAQR